MFYMDLISLIGLSESRKRYIKYVDTLTEFLVEMFHNYAFKECISVEKLKL